MITTTWRAIRLHAGRVRRLTELPWESQLSFLSKCPRHPSKRAIFWPCNTSKQRYIPNQLLLLTASGDYVQLTECKRIAPETEKRPLADTMIKNLILLAKAFLLSAIFFTVFSSCSRDSPLTIPLRWVASKGGLCFNPVSWGTLLPYKQGIRVNYVSGCSIRSQQRNLVCFPIFQLCPQKQTFYVAKNLQNREINLRNYRRQPK